MAHVADRARIGRAAPRDARSDWIAQPGRSRCRVRCGVGGCAAACWPARRSGGCDCELALLLSARCAACAQVWKNGQKQEELVGANKDNLERMAAKYA